jgi:hypothetical protein
LRKLIVEVEKDERKVFKNEKGPVVAAEGEEIEALSFERDDQQ